MVNYNLACHAKDIPAATAARMLDNDHVLPNPLHANSKDPVLPKQDGKTDIDPLHRNNKDPSHMNNKKPVLPADHPPHANDKNPVLPELHRNNKDPLHTNNKNPFLPDGAQADLYHPSHANDKDPVLPKQDGAQADVLREEHCNDVNDNETLGVYSHDSNWILFKYPFLAEKLDLAVNGLNELSWKSVHEQKAVPEQPFHVTITWNDKKGSTKSKTRTPAKGQQQTDSKQKNGLGRRAAQQTGSKKRPRKDQRASQTNALMNKLSDENAAYFVPMFQEDIDPFSDEMDEMDQETLPTRRNVICKCLELSINERSQNPPELKMAFCKCLEISINEHQRSPPELDFPSLELEMAPKSLKVTLGYCDMVKREMTCGKQGKLGLPAIRFILKNCTEYADPSVILEALPVGTGVEKLVAKELALIHQREYRKAYEAFIKAYPPPPPDDLGPEAPEPRKPILKYTSIHLLSLNKNSKKAGTSFNGVNQTYLFKNTKDEQVLPNFLPKFSDKHWMKVLGQKRLPKFFTVIDKQQKGLPERPKKGINKRKKKGINEHKKKGIDKHYDDARSRKDCPRDQGTKSGHGERKTNKTNVLRKKSEEKKRIKLPMRPVQLKKSETPETKKRSAAPFVPSLNKKHTHKRDLPTRLTKKRSVTLMALKRHSAKPVALLEHKTMSNLNTCWKIMRVVGKGSLKEGTFYWIACVAYYTYNPGSTMQLYCHEKIDEHKQKVASYIQFIHQQV
eukprot:jgi/Psemu1/17375/gm1.17375_g